MKRFAVYDVRTGRILRVGTCWQNELPSQVHGDGEGLLETSQEVDPERYAVVMGTLVRITPGHKKSIEAGPLLFGR